MSKHLPVVQSDERYAENFAVRKKLADEAALELDAAIELCGPGAAAYGRWVITDKLGDLAPRVIYCCSRPTFAGWTPDAHFEGWDERIGADRDPGVEVKGVVYRLFRFSTAFQSLGVYIPRTAEQTKAAAEKRRAKAIAAVEAEAAAAEAARREYDDRNPSLLVWAGIEESR